MNKANIQRHLAKGLALTAAGLTLAVLSGCGDMPPIAHGEDFTPAGSQTSIGRFAQSQAANGARNDATLGSQHFQGADLNSLGEVKLDLMLHAAPSNAPMVVYMDMPHSAPKESVVACKTSVTNYLVDAGVPLAQIQLVDGGNPNCTAPSAFTLPSIYKPDSGSFTGAATDTLGPADLNAVGTGPLGSGSGK